MDHYRYPAPAVRSLISEIFEACAMKPSHASAVADVLIESDLRGVASHGVSSVPYYVAAIKSGAVEPKAEPTIFRENRAAVVLDGNGAMGQIVATMAMQMAVERANHFGIAASAARGTFHIGAAGHYVRYAVDQGMTGIVCTTSLPTMAPTGGSDRVLGMNPLAIGIPGGSQDPVILDMAFAVAARRRIGLYKDQGYELPDGWALDNSGAPTTDPREALEGLLLPIGGYKGSGMAVCVGLLATIFGGASFGLDLGDLEGGAKPARDGLLAIAINPELFIGAQDSATSFDRSVGILRGSHPTEDGTIVRLPGERASNSRSENERNGIPISFSTLNALETLCRELSVDSEVFHVSGS